MGGENATSENPNPPILFSNFLQNFYPPKPNYLIFKIFRIFPKNILTNENIPVRLDAWAGRMPRLKGSYKVAKDKNFHVLRP
jgi:hypothetical protein